MTVPSENKRNQYEGNGSTTVFPYTFKITDQGHLLVTFTDTDGNDTVLTVDTHYTVSGVGETGGNVTYPVSGSELAADEYLTITRNVPLTQLTDLKNQGTFNAEVLETADDYSMMAIQYLQEQIDRCPKLAVGTTEDAETLTGTVAEQVTACQAAQSAAEAAQAAAEGLFKYASTTISISGSNPYTVTNALRGYVITLNPTANIIVNMPVIVTGHVYIIKNISTTGGTLTINPAGAENTDLTTIYPGETVVLYAYVLTSTWKVLFRSGYKIPTQIKTDSYVLTAEDSHLQNIMNASTVKVFTLPALTEGAVYRLSNIGSREVTIKPNGSDTADIDILGRNGSVELVGDATNDVWRVKSLKQGSLYNRNLNAVSCYNNQSNPNYQIDASISFDIDGRNLSVSGTVDITASGANGLDTGAEANSTWYYLYVIASHDFADTAFVLSTSFVAPTMPSGYTRSKLVSAVYNDGSGNLLQFYQVWDKILYDQAGISLLAAGTDTSYTDIDCSTAVPVIADEVLITTSKSVAGDSFFIRPNGMYGSTTVYSFNAAAYFNMWVALGTLSSIEYKRNSGTGNITITARGFKLYL